MAYHSVTDALRQMLLMREFGGDITKIPAKIKSLPGGPYYFVEVTSSEGAKYIIEAYGKEAIELQMEATSTRKQREDLVIA